MRTAIFDTGNFKLVDPLTEDTRDGVKLTWQVKCLRHQHPLSLA